MTDKLSAELILTLPVGDQLGEGIQWHEESQSIWWTDIEGSCLRHYQLSANHVITHQMPERVGSFAFIEQDERIMVAFERGFALYDIKHKTLEWLAQPEIENLGNRFNDGRVDRSGNFWAGTMIQAPSDDSIPAGLYRYNAKTSQCDKLISGITVSNGLCFSPDGKKLYHADSPTRQIVQFDLNEQGELSNRSVFATTQEHSFPDGSAIDAQGYLWNAQWGGSRVVRYAPDGSEDFILNVPVIQPSCVAIGGPNMNWLLITSAKESLSKEQLADDINAGHVFIYQLNQEQLGLLEDKVTL